LGNGGSGQGDTRRPGRCGRRRDRPASALVRSPGSSGASGRVGPARSASSRPDRCEAARENAGGSNVSTTGVRIQAKRYSSNGKQRARRIRASRLSLRAGGGDVKLRTILIVLSALLMVLLSEGAAAALDEQ